MIVDECPVVEPKTRAVVPIDEARDIALRFITGESVADIAAFYGKHRATVERILRQAYASMSEVVGQLSHNDGVSQRRIQALEARADQAEAFRALSFWQRMRWILRGEQ